MELFSIESNSSSNIPLPSMTNFKPFHSRGLCEAVTINADLYFLDSLKATGVGAIPILNISIPCAIRPAQTVLNNISLDGRVSLARKQVFVPNLLMKEPNILENFTTSWRERSLP